MRSWLRPCAQRCFAQIDACALCGPRCRCQGGSPRAAGREGRLGLGPRQGLGHEEALRIQLQALQRNNTPYNNHGIEVMYRFAKFDPFERSAYFGCAVAAMALRRVGPQPAQGVRALALP